MSKLKQNKFNCRILPKRKKSGYTITKIQDDFNGFHPNGIFKGYSVTGGFEKKPTVGERFEIVGNGVNDYLMTSTVVEIIDDETFRTENSVYKLVKN